MNKFFIILGDVVLILNLVASLVLFHGGHKIDAVYALLLAAFLYRITEDLKERKIVIRIFLNDVGESEEEMHPMVKASFDKLTALADEREKER